MFQDKYAIDLATDLDQLIEEQIKKVMDETKAAKRRHLKDLLLKKLRMFNMIAKFCKIGELSEIKRQNGSAQRIL